MFSEHTSSSRPPRRSAALPLAPVLAALLLGLVASGCGKKGEPLPPVKLVPKEAADFAVRQRGSELLFAVSYPQVTIGGLPLAGIDRMEVLRFTTSAPTTGEPPPVDPRQFASGAEVVETLRGKDLTDSTEGPRLVWRRQVAAEELAGQRAHLYAVRFVTPGGEASVPSNRGNVILSPPPVPPANLEAVAQERGVEIRWTDGAEGVGGYRIYRRLAEARTYGDPLSTVGGEVASYLDTTARYDQRYIYAVTSVAAERPGLESTLVAEREIDYRDRFAPPPPEGLVALAESAQVRLTWQSSPATDLAGYHVYRRRAAEPDFTRVNESLLTEARFLVSGLAPGVSYVFRVTAVDAVGNESMPGDEATATVR